MYIEYGSLRFSSHRGVNLFGTSDAFVIDTLDIWGDRSDLGDLAITTDELSLDAKSLEEDLLSEAGWQRVDIFDDTHDMVFETNCYKIIMTFRGEELRRTLVEVQRDNESCSVTISKIRGTTGRNIALPAFPNEMVKVLGRPTSQVVHQRW